MATTSTGEVTVAADHPIDPTAAVDEAGDEVVP